MLQRLTLTPFVRNVVSAPLLQTFVLIRNKGAEIGLTIFATYGDDSLLSRLSDAAEKLIVRLTLLFQNVTQ